MKIKNFLLITTGAAAGYVLGARAGRARFEELKARANDFVHSPKVQEGVSTVADKVSESADRLPGPAGGIVKGAATQVKNAVSSVGSTTSSQSYDIPAGGTSVAPEFGGAASDEGFETPRRADDSSL